MLQFAGVRAVFRTKRTYVNVNSKIHCNNGEQLGSLIQDYVKARWGEPGGERAAAPGALLDEALRERVDILGMDGVRLLHVAAVDVLAELERLEGEAAREDARVAVAAARVRAQEVEPKDQANPARRNPRMRPGRPSEPAKRGRRRQRGQR